MGLKLIIYYCKYFESNQSNIPIIIKTTFFYERLDTSLKIMAIYFNLGILSHCSVL